MSTTSTKVLATFVAAVSLFSVGVSAFAQDKMSTGSMMSDHKMAMDSKMGMHHMVYVCTTCKMYYMPMTAKKMGYKDSMGHKLMKMSHVPMGYTSGAKMMDSKMSGSKM